MSGKIKGGYKNVSLKGVDLIGASPEVDGLYDALINSYDKPIQLCNIIIDGVKKKNAFVQVKKDGNYVIVENLYGYKLTIGNDNAIGVSQAIPEELPDASEASEGDALLLDAQKKPVWGKFKLEDIVDKDGHKRFVEGDIVGNEISGITWEYGKWSLSGSHMLIVLSGSLTNEVTINYQSFAEWEIPDWIYQKIKIITSNIIEFKSVLAYAENQSSQSMNVLFRKLALNKLSVYLNNSITLTANRNFRIEFDLLID